MNSKPIQSAFLALAAATTLVAGAVSPAMAAGNDPAKAEAKQVQQTVPDAKSDKKRYCIKQSFTGTRVAKSECRTRAEWIQATGQDPVADR